jgi:lysyl-tRNA synthetase class 2
VAARAAVLSPSDLRAHPSGPVRVGGRVADAKPDALVLHDAKATVAVRGAFGEVNPGDLVIVRGRWARGVVRDAGLVEHFPHPSPRGDGDVARLGWSGAGQRLEQRARVLAAIRDYFCDEGFLEVETPVRVRAPGVDAHVDAFRAEGGYLITSPELHLKRLLVGGFPRVFELSRVLRAHESGRLHEPEFTLLEWYRAFAGQHEIRRDTERIVERAAKSVQKRAELALPDGRRIRCQRPFPVVSVREAFRRFAGVKDAVDLAQSDEARYFELMVSRVEPGLAKLDRPVFLTDYPISQAALARSSPADARVAERFELYVGGIELANGYGELTDPGEQARRFAAERARRRRERRRVYPTDQKFLAALREGMPPSGGNALGVDRLVMLAAGADSVASVRAFPWGS